jgi:hypothetical protein
MTQQTRIITRSLNGILIRERHNRLIDKEIRVLPAMRNPAKPTIRAHPLQDHQARFVRWLAIAVLLHALLLLIPARQALSPGPTLTALTVALSRTLRAPPPATPVERGREDRASAERRQAPPSAPAAESPPAIAPAVAPAFAPALDTPAAAPSDTVPSGAESAPVTMASLLDFGHRREWNLPEPSDPPRLGVLTPQPPPNWRSGTPAEGTAPPAKTGIIDQWLAGDGSRNVMIRTSTGQVLCGRAEAWNPMSPLVEPVMMYRACGTGRRTFEMPARPARVLLR